LNDSAAFVLPGSQLAAVASARAIHVYYQCKTDSHSLRVDTYFASLSYYNLCMANKCILALDGVINEYSSLDTESGWKHAKTHALALRGSSIAATAFPGRGALEVHLYYQGEDLAVREYVRVGYSWKFGALSQSRDSFCFPLSSLLWRAEVFED